MDLEERGLVLATVGLKDLQIFRFDGLSEDDDGVGLWHGQDLGEVERFLLSIHQRRPCGSDRAFRAFLTSFLGNQSPSTSGFSSTSSSAQARARDCPRDASSRKKLTPRSASSTLAASAMANLPIPRLGEKGLR
jgi:hypothetical protein